MLAGLKPMRGNIGRDTLAGLTAAIAAIPDGMASAVLAGVNPVFGLYNLIIGTPVGALTTSSVYMAVINTSAMALVVNTALTDYSGPEQLQAMVTLTLLVGIFQLALGLLKLGFLTRFISNSVMVGFLTGIAIIIILSQLGDFTGFSGEGSNKVAQTLDLARNFRLIDLHTLAIGLLTLVLIVVLDRTRLGPIAMLIALVVAAVAVWALGWDSVTLVGDTALIPQSLPRPALPDLTLIPTLASSAVAIGIIGLVQGAGVSQGYSNPDGKFPDASGDFRGQGFANIAAGFFRGIPLGGSVSGTALVVNAGARSRWANILTGIFVAAGVLLFANAISALPMTALAAILIYAGYQTIKPTLIREVWQTNNVSRAMMVITFVFTLFLPVQQAIFLGVGLHAILFIYQASERMTIMELKPVDSSDFEEAPAPAILPNHQVTMLLPYGSLFFAGAADFEEEAPVADDVQGAVVILILRGRLQVGSTFLNVIERYADILAKNGGQLILADVSERVQRQLDRTETLAIIGEENVIPSNPRIFAAMQEAWAVGERALEELRESRSNPGPGA